MWVKKKKQKRELHILGKEATNIDDNFNLIWYWVFLFYGFYAEIKYNFKIIECHLLL